MFNKKVKNRIKLLNKDKEAYPALSWLKKDKKQIRQFIADNPVSVRKETKQSRNIVEKVDFTNLNAQKPREFVFLGLKLQHMKMKTIIASFLIAAVLIGGGASAVSAHNSLPGETFYPVKLAAEKIQLVLAGDEDDVKLHAKFASKRADELKELISQAKSESVEINTELIKITASKLEDEIKSSEKGLTALASKGEDVAELALEIEDKTNQQVNILEDIINYLPNEDMTSDLPDSYLPDYKEDQNLETQTSLEQTKQAVKQSQVNTLEIISQTGQSEKGYSETIKSKAMERVNIRLEQAKTEIEIFKEGIESTEKNKYYQGFLLPQYSQGLLPPKLEEEQSISETFQQIKNINIIFNEIEDSETQDNKSIPGGGGGGVVVPPEPITEPDAPERMTMEEAVKIAWANPGCIKYGLETDSGSYNSQSHTWWFNLKHKTDTCDYACVVYALEKRAEVYPMCRGLILPEEIMPEN